MEWNENGFTFPETEDQRCSEANCFTHSFEYSASNQQIEVKTTQKVDIYHYNISGDSKFINDLHSVDQACVHCKFTDRKGYSSHMVDSYQSVEITGLIQTVAVYNR